MANLGDSWYQRLAFDVLCSLSHNNCSLISQYTVNDLVWGYKDPFLNFISTLQPGISPIFQLQSI